MRKYLIFTTLTYLLAMPPVLADAPTQWPEGAARKSATPAGVPRLSARGEITGPELMADRRADQLAEEGDALLVTGDYFGAEKKFRAAEAVVDWNPQADRGLAEALAGEGKLSEALQVYRVVTTENPHKMSSITNEIRTQMGFAILLSRTGQWPEAVSVYEKALPRATQWGDAPKIDVHFDPQVPMPAQLQSLAHVAVGTEFFGYLAKASAFSEFEKAMSIDPNSGFANYYYGYGWERLDPTDKLRVINAQQAKAALQKAVKIGNADVKKAAAKALKDAG